MIRFTQLAHPNLILVRKQVGDGSCAALIVMRAPQRQYSANLDKYPQSSKSTPKSRKLLWGTVGATILTGAAVVYAKQSPDVRNWLASNAPWANNFVALVYQENTTYWKFTVGQFNKIVSTVTDFVFGKEGVTPLEIPKLADQDLEKDAEKAFAKKSYESTPKIKDEVPPPTLEPLFVQTKTIGTPEITAPATVVQTDKCEPQSVATVKVTKDMVEIEHEMHENTKTAMDNFKTAIKFCEDYNKALYRIVEASADDLNMKNFSSLRAAKDGRDQAIKKATESSAKARCALETLDRMIKAGGIQAPPETLAATRRYINQFREDLQESEIKYRECCEMAILSDKYWNKVEAARTAFKEELQMIFPGIDLNARQLDIRGETDLLLLYTLKQVQYLQKELAELQTIRDLKINRAIECRDDKAIIDLKVEDVMKKELMLKEKEFQKKSLAIQAEANRKLREQLKKQFEIQEEILQDRLKKKEAEVLAKFNRAVSEEMQNERVNFKKELAAMAGKLRAIEETLRQRGRAEAEARRSQALWAAAEALRAAVRRPAPAAQVDRELRALERAGKDDKLVQTVLKSIPQEVRDNGVATEKALKDRFDALEKNASKVALVGSSGATLPVYFLSWVQSKLLFQQFAEIPEDELENRPTDFTALDTFDIIQRARYHMNDGNLGAALQYVNLLQGAPRAVAKAWVEQVRSHLEIRQAAEAVMAHASVSGMLYL